MEEYLKVQHHKVQHHKSINTEEINDNYLISEMTNIIKELNKEKEITIDL